MKRIGCKILFFLLVTPLLFGCTRIFTEPTPKPADYTVEDLLDEFDLERVKITTPTSKVPEKMAPSPQPARNEKEPSETKLSEEAIPKSTVSVRCATSLEKVERLIEKAHTDTKVLEEIFFSTKLNTCVYLSHYTVGMMAGWYLENVSNNTLVDSCFVLNEAYQSECRRTKTDRYCDSVIDRWLEDADGKPGFGCDDFTDKIQSWR